nr:28S ribosomal protein S9 mitochondrial [Hymenolepis microstoma]
MLEEERVKYENGKKFLARLMGHDPDTINQEQVDEAIRYLFPSGLQSKNAHPRLKPPEEVYPEKKKLQFDRTGRPFHDLYYTGKPAYFETMHKASALFEELNLLFDRGYIDRDFTGFKNPRAICLKCVAYEGPAQSEAYANWLRVMNALLKHPLAWHAESFINSYRVSVQETFSDEAYPEILIPTVGLSTLLRLLEFFPHLGDREQIMFPLQYTGMLGSVDVVAKISSDTETGHSSKANALRLAVARALACFLPGDQGFNRLRAAGLLTQDDRFSERKKPGQKKARKKPIWKAR